MIKIVVIIILLFSLAGVTVYFTQFHKTTNDTVKITCGPGTLKNRDGTKCVVDDKFIQNTGLTCGNGTVKDGDKCVLNKETKNLLNSAKSDTDTISCGDGTDKINNKCVLNTETKNLLAAAEADTDTISCGDGTDKINNECVLNTETKNLLVTASNNDKVFDQLIKIIDIEIKNIENERKNILTAKNRHRSDPLYMTFMSDMDDKLKNLEDTILPLLDSIHDKCSDQNDECIKELENYFKDSTSKEYYREHNNNCNQTLWSEDRAAQNSKECKNSPTCGPVHKIPGNNITNINDAERKVLYNRVATMADGKEKTYILERLNPKMNNQDTIDNFNLDVGTLNQLKNKATEVEGRMLPVAQARRIIEKHIYNPAPIVNDKLSTCWERTTTKCNGIDINILKRTGDGGESCNKVTASEGDGDDSGGQQGFGCGDGTNLSSNGVCVVDTNLYESKANINNLYLKKSSNTINMIKGKNKTIDSADVFLLFDKSEKHEFVANRQYKLYYTPTDIRSDATNAKMFSKTSFYNNDGNENVPYMFVRYEGGTPVTDVYKGQEYKKYNFKIKDPDQPAKNIARPTSDGLEQTIPKWLGKTISDISGDNAIDSMNIYITEINEDDYLKKSNISHDYVLESTMATTHVDKNTHDIEVAEKQETINNLTTERDNDYVLRSSIGPTDCNQLCGGEGTFMCSNDCDSQKQTLQDSCENQSDSNCFQCNTDDMTPDEFGMCQINSNYETPFDPNDCGLNTRYDTKKGKCVEDKNKVIDINKHNEIINAYKNTLNI